MGDEWGDFPVNNRFDDWSAAEGGDPFGGDKKPAASSAQNNGNSDPFGSSGGGGGGNDGDGGGKWPGYGSDSGHDDEDAEYGRKDPPGEDHFADEHDEQDTYDDGMDMGASAPETYTDDDEEAGEGGDGLAPLRQSGPPPQQRQVPQSASSRMRELQQSLNEDEEEDNRLGGGGGAPRRSGAERASNARGSGAGPRGSRPPGSRPPNGKGGKKPLPTEKREKNERFKDVESTGKWGALNKWEIIAAAVLGIGAIVAVVVVIVVVVIPNANAGGETVLVPASAPPTMSPAPTAAPTSDLASAYEQIQQASPEVTTWPEDPEDLRGSLETPSASRQFKAAEFVLYEDPLKLKSSDPWFLQRYGLYNFYLSTNGGSTWSTTTNWPEGTKPCEFYGVECDFTQSFVKKLLMSNNGLSGQIPYEIESLMELNELDLYGNTLTGPLPAQALVDSEKLSTLNVQRNSLSGTIPAELQNSKIAYFYIVDSGLTGDIPNEICSNMDTIFTNCEQNACPYFDQNCWEPCQGPACD